MVEWHLKLKLSSKSKTVCFNFMKPIVSNKELNNKINELLTQFNLEDITINYGY